MSIVNNVKSSAKLNREFVAFRSRIHYEDIVDVDSKEDIPFMGNEDTRIEFARHEVEIDNRVVEREVPDTGCLFEPVQ